jgi:hypothetical protein
MKKRPILAAVVLLLAVIAAGCKKDNSFDAEFERAARVIAERDTWPESPQDVSAAFWNARYKKDYSEMHILWPGSASYNWPQTCAKDTGVKYVFGEARIITSYGDTGQIEEAEVPYASQEHFKEHGTYNLTMKLRALNTQRGRRWYVYSGN